MRLAPYAVSVPFFADCKDAVAVGSGLNKFCGRLRVGAVRPAAAGAVSFGPSEPTAGFQEPSPKIRRETDGNSDGSDRLWSEGLETVDYCVSSDRPLPFDNEDTACRFPSSFNESLLGERRLAGVAYRCVRPIGWTGRIRWRARWERSLRSVRASFRTSLPSSA